jgi:YYY domain-containing protein
MSETIRWWLAMQLIALPMMPLCLAMFRRLPDRGYALSKPFALLLLGFTFWFFNSIRILPNSAAGIIVALVALAAIAAWFLYRERDDIIEWLGEHWRYVAAVEALLLITFALAVWLRHFVGSISGTEQPMDLMFLNAATHAEHFPPEDPWLSGHTVAYYYFGYLIVAMVGKLAAVPTAIGYNIGLGMIASLSLVGAFGIVYNLVAMRERPGVRTGEDAAPVRERAPKPEKQSRRAAMPVQSERGAMESPANFASSIAARDWKPFVFGIAGGVILVLLGNLVFLFTFASAYGIGGDGFYSWLDVARDPGDPNSGLTGNEQRDTWYPSQFFEYFSASRIYPINNEGFRAITEFPMFSFLLGDLHPHVMALPFVLLVVGAALTLNRSDEPLDITFWLQRPLLLVATAIMLGALAFINTWDIATFSFLVVAAAFASNFGRVRGLTGDLLLQVATFAVPLLLLALLLYIPFYASFTSQADGVLPVVSRDGVTQVGTRPVHFLLFWGMPLAVVIPFVATRVAAARARITGTMLAVTAADPLVILLGWALLFAWHRLTDNADLAAADGFFAQLVDRGSGWLTAIAIGAMLAAALLALWLELTGADEREERRAPLFALMLVTTSLLLILGTEFFYVGDVFNVRMNTVFKLYYQAWLLLALAAGFSLYALVSGWSAGEIARPWRIAWAAGVAIVLAGAALYTAGGTFNRIRPYDAAGNPHDTYSALDGLQYLSPNERAGIDRLRELADHQEFVIVEAVGNDYTLAGRISMATGIPTVLGWGGHEDQWRGGTAEARAGRFEDVEALYRASDLVAVEQITRKYGVSYIYVGDLERSTYGDAALEKFRTLPVAFESGSVAIYHAPGRTGDIEANR